MPVVSKIHNSYETILPLHDTSVACNIETCRKAVFRATKCFFFFLFLTMTKKMNIK